MTVRLAQIRIFPLKSFDAAARDHACVLPAGCLENDRRYALFDAAGKYVNGKRTPLVHAMRASFNLDCTKIRLTDQEIGNNARDYDLRYDITQVTKYLSEHFGFPVSLRENREAGFPDDTLSGGPTIIAAETLQSVAGWFDIPFEEARDRFRANLVVEGGGPFWDDHLFRDPGATVTFRVGDVLLVGTNPCARCVVPSRHPRSGESIAGFVKIFSAARRRSLAAWAAPDAFDHFYRLAVNTRLYALRNGGVIRVGDIVEILN